MMSINSKFCSSYLLKLSTLTACLFIVNPVLGSDTDYVDAPEDGVELGLGWDSATGTLVPSRCIRFAPIQEGGQVLSLDLDEVTDSSELAENLDVSAEATVDGMLGSATAKAEFVKNGNVKASSTTFSLRATAQNGTLFAGPLMPPENRRYAFTSVEKQLIPIWMQDGSDDDKDLSVRLEEWALDILKKKEGEKLFRKYCGDNYISAITSGAELLAVITFETKEETTKESLSASIEGSYSIASGAASLDLDHSEEAKSSHLKVSYLQVGGARGAIPTTNEGLKRKLSVLANEAADAPVFYEIGIKDYEDLPNWPTDSDAPTDHDELTELLSDRDLALYTLYRHLQSVITAPGEYSIVPDQELFEPRYRMLADFQDRILVVRKLIAEFQQQRHLLELSMLRGEPMGDTKKIIAITNSLIAIDLPDVKNTTLKPAITDYKTALINVRKYLKQLNVPKMRLWLPLPSHISTPEKDQYASTLVQFYLGKQSRRACERNPIDESCLNNSELREMEFDVSPNYHQLKLRNTAKGYLFSSLKDAEGCLSASENYKETTVKHVDKNSVDLRSSGCTLFNVQEIEGKFFLSANNHYLTLNGTRVFLGEEAEKSTSEWSVFFNNKLGIDEGICMTAEKDSQQHIGGGTCTDDVAGWFFVPTMLFPIKE